MTPHDLLTNFEVLAEAPNGVQRLRELVLNLAVRGKLVEQDPGDPSPVDFLRNLESQRNRGSRSKDANPKLPIIPQKDAPFTIPSSWCWTRFEFTHINRDSERIPLSREQRSGQKGRYDYYGASGVIDGVDRYLFDKPLLLLGEDGANLVLRSTPIAFMATGQYWVNNHAHVLDSPDEMSLHYLAIFLNQCDMKPYLTGTAQPKLNQARMNSIPCPFPPLPEQARIVARVDELMALLDSLEAKCQEREVARAAACDSALAALRDAPTPEDVEIEWLRVQERFSELFVTSKDVESLRQAVLFLAGEGRLVTQHPGDGSALDLLKRIDHAKAKRAKDGLERRRKEVSAAAIDTEHHSLPQGWAWASIDQCCDVVGGIQKTAARRPRNHAFPYLRVANVQRGRFDLSEIAQFELEPGEMERWRLEPADLLIVEGNGSEDEIGRCAMWTGQIPDCVHQNHLIRCRPVLSELAPYILHYFNSPQGIGTMKSMAVTTSGLYNLSVGKIRSIWFPLPPEGEQRRILQRVGELMQSLEQLRASLGYERQLSGSFAGAAVHHLEV